MNRYFTDLSSLKSAFKKTLAHATNNMSKKVLDKVDEEFMNYYLDYNPLVYNRTGAMSYVPKKTDAILSGNSVNAEVFLDTDYDYDVGNWSGKEVIESANQGLHGGQDLGTGDVKVWDNPINEIDSNSHAMWAESLKKAGLNVK